MSVASSACGVAPQPASSRTVAAFEVPLPTESERNEFLALLSHEAVTEDFHVDASNSEELLQRSEVSPMTIHAGVWRGKDDDEIVASIMDHEGHLGAAWITFSKGEQPERVARFRDRVMKRVLVRWPKTRALPIMPTGVIPLHDDLVPTKNGYRVKRAEASKYELRAPSPLIAAD